MISISNGQVKIAGKKSELFADMSVIILKVAMEFGYSVMDILNLYLDAIQDQGIDITKPMMEMSVERGEVRYEYAEDERSTEEVEGIYEKDHKELHDRKAIYRRS